MTALLATLLGLIFAYAIYIAAAAGRASAPAAFLDAGGTLPPWGYMFAATGVMIAGLGLQDHLELVARYGLQVSHVAIGLVLAGVTGALLLKRLWLASRMSGLGTLGDLLGAYFASPALRLYLLLVLALLAVPFSAIGLAKAAALVAAVTGGAIPEAVALWASLVFLFIASALGGWRGIVYLVAAESLLLIAALAYAAGFPALGLGRWEFIAKGFTTGQGVLADQIPGVIQFTRGLGKEVPAGGLWTTVGILSSAAAALGLILSPGIGFLGLTTSARKGFAFAHVWMIAGLGAGLLLLAAPLIAAELGGVDFGGVDASPLAAFAARLERIDLFAATIVVLVPVIGAQIVALFFAGSAASIATIELVGRYVLPDLTPGGRRLSARIVLALLYLAIGIMAHFLPILAMILASVTLSLALQVLPALIGLCWLPWLSRSAVLSGLILGGLLVVFTEPPGLILFEGLFVELPWGRWPWTIHSAGWGLIFNIAAGLIVAPFTRGGAERAHRERLHDAFRAGHRADLGGRGARGAKWSLTLIWLFMALGPGAILGNRFFSDPIFTEGAIPPGLQSLLTWQIMWWLVGVLIVWWLAYPSRLSVIETDIPRPVNLIAPVNRLQRAPSPRWITRLVERLARRQGPPRPHRS